MPAGLAGYGRQLLIGHLADHHSRHLVSQPDQLGDGESIMY